MINYQKKIFYDLFIKKEKKNKIFNLKFKNSRREIVERMRGAPRMRAV